MTEPQDVPVIVDIDGAIEHGDLAAFRDCGARVTDSGMNHFHIEIGDETVAMVRFTADSEAADRRKLEAHLLGHDEPSS